MYTNTNNILAQLPSKVIIIKIITNNKPFERNTLILSQKNTKKRERERKLNTAKIASLSSRSSNWSERSDRSGTRFVDRSPATRSRIETRFVFGKKVFFRYKFSCTRRFFFRITHTELSFSNFYPAREEFFTFLIHAAIGII